MLFHHAIKLPIISVEGQQQLPGPSAVGGLYAQTKT
jgi:hypothetical protein